MEEVFYTFEEKICEVFSTKIILITYIKVKQKLINWFTKDVKVCQQELILVLIVMLEVVP